MFSRVCFDRLKVGAVVGAVALMASTSAYALPNGLTVLGEYEVPVLESEVGGVAVHPTKSDHYLLTANANPAYAAGVKPRLDEALRGKLLVVEQKTGKVVESFDIGGKAYGGMAASNDMVYISSLEPPELIQFDLKKGKVVDRIALDGPAGGLEYDPATKNILAQLYLGHPHLAVVNTTKRATTESLWSDENAMGLALVGSDLLCTWASSFDDHAKGELRLIDTKTGKVKGRVALDGYYSSMSPLRGKAGFAALYTKNKKTGQVVIREVGYDAKSVRW